MKRFLYPLSIVALLLACGCSTEGGGPMIPDLSSPDGVCAPQDASISSRSLWGIYQVDINKLSGDVEILPVRGATFNANVQQFLSPPYSPVHLMTVLILPGSNMSKGDLNLEIGLNHPFTGMNFYKGFDVRGIFLADGSQMGTHDSHIRYGSADSNQAYMRNPDGYTRWWNPSEFTDSMPLLSYKPGKLGTDPNPSATLNPYKYFADDVAIDGDVAGLSPGTRGVFSPNGQPHKRIYKIQFPVNGTPSFQFNYAIDASWEAPDASGDPDYPVDSFPPGAQCQEAYHVTLDTSGTNAWCDDGSTGGSVNLSIEIFDWQALTNPVGVTGEVAAIWVESPVLASPVNILPVAIDSPGSQTTSRVFEVEFSDDELNLSAPGTFSMLVCVESASPATYQPQLDGGENLIFPEGPLAAYSIGSVIIDGEITGFTITCPNGGEGLNIGGEYDIEWSGGTEIADVKLEYSRDDFAFDFNEITASTPNNGSFNWTPIPDDPSETVLVRVSDVDDPLNYDDSDDYFEISDQCQFYDPLTYDTYQNTDVTWSSGYHFLQIDSNRIVANRFYHEGNSSWPWLAVYNDSDYSSQVDTFNVPGWSFPHRPWAFEVDSTDRIFFFMADEDTTAGGLFNVFYYVDWIWNTDHYEFDESSFSSFDISSFLDSGEEGDDIWLDSNDDLFVLSTLGKVIKFNHADNYSGSVLFDLNSNPDFQPGSQIDFFLAEEINAFFIYTGYGTGNKHRAIQKVSYDGTVLDKDLDLFSGIVTSGECGTYTGGIAADGDCRLIVIDGHIMHSPNLVTVRYDFNLEQKAWSVQDVPTYFQPGNTIHFDTDGRIRFNDGGWWSDGSMQVHLAFFYTPGDW